MSETIVKYGNSVQKEALSLVERAKHLRIITLKDFELSGEFVMSLVRIRKGLNEYWKKSVADAKQSYDTQKSLRDADLKPVEEVEEYITEQRRQFKTEQDRLARIKQERLENEAKEKADKERQALLDKAAEMEKINPKKAEALMEKAEAVIESPVFVERKIENTTKLESGGSITWLKDIVVEVISVRAVCHAISQGFIPETCVEFKNLKQLAKLNNWKGEIHGLNIKETQRESKKT